MRNRTSLAILLVAGMLAMSGAAIAAAPVDRAEPRFLTGPAKVDPLELGLDYVRAHRTQWGLSEADLKDHVVRSRYLSRHNGVTHLYLRQRLNGIEVFQGDLQIHVAADGRL